MKRAAIATNTQRNDLANMAGAIRSSANRLMGVVHTNFNRDDISAELGRIESAVRDMRELVNGMKETK